MLEDATLHFMETTKVVLVALYPFHYTRQHKMGVQIDRNDIFGLSATILGECIC